MSDQPISGPVRMADTDRMSPGALSGWAQTLSEPHQNLLSLPKTMANELLQMIVIEHARLIHILKEARTLQDVREAAAPFAENAEQILQAANIAVSEDDDSISLLWQENTQALTSLYQNWITNWTAALSAATGGDA